MHYTSGTTGRAKGVWSGLWDAPTAAAAPAPTRPTCGRSVPTTSTWSARRCTTRCRSGSPAGTLLARRDLRRPRATSTPRRRPAALAGGSGPCPTTTFLAPVGPDPPAGPARHRTRTGSAPCGCWSTPGRRARRPSSGRPSSVVGPGVLWEFYGSTEGQFTVCSPDGVARAAGHRGRARPGRDAVGRRRRDRLVPPARLRPVRLLARRGQDRGRLAGRRLHRGRPRPARRRRLPLPRRPPRRPRHHRRGQRLPGRGGGGPGRGARASTRWPCSGWPTSGGASGSVRRGGSRRAGADPDAVLGRRWPTTRPTTWPAYKRPKQYEVVDALPRTATGKVRRTSIPGALATWSEPDGGSTGRGAARDRADVGDTGRHERRRRRSSHRHHQPRDRRAARDVRALRRRRRRGAVWPPRRPRPGRGRPARSRSGPGSSITAAELLEGEVPDIAHVGHHRDGQALRPGQGRGGQVRRRVPVVRRARRGDARRPRRCRSTPRWASSPTSPSG